MKVAFTSDYHIDTFRQSIAQCIIDETVSFLIQNKVEVLSYAGDMSSSLETTFKKLNFIKKQYEVKTNNRLEIFAVPGNHEMWDKKYRHQPYGALNEFEMLCDKYDIKHSFFSYKGNYFVGEMGWYNYSTAHPSFSKKELEKMTYAGSVWSDKDYVNFGKSSNEHVASFFTSKLEENIKKVPEHLRNKIILVTHIVPFIEFVERKNDPSWDYFNAFIGDQQIGLLAEKYNVKISQFGHTHKKYYSNISGIQCICSPLGYKGEWSTDDVSEEIKKSIKIINL